jgi:hypothetical protein
MAGATVTRSQVCTAAGELNAAEWNHWTAGSTKSTSVTDHFGAWPGDVSWPDTADLQNLFICAERLLDLLR